MTSIKLHPGNAFPVIKVADETGTFRDLSRPAQGLDWIMVVVYRGQHCPPCTRYLNALASHRDELAEIGVDLVAVSGDSADQLARHREQLDVGFPLYHSLQPAQMQQLGVYISEPRSKQETDHPFSEPALFVVNESGQLHVADVSNNPFVRPDIPTLVRGLRWIRNPENNYPIRGARRYA